MRKLVLFAAMLSLACGVAFGAETAPKGGKPVVQFETSMGVIKVELYPEKAPITVKNFLAYVREGYYDGLIFHRVIRDFMIQGGGFTKENAQVQTLRKEKDQAAAQVQTLEQERNETIARSQALEQERDKAVAIDQAQTNTQGDDQVSVQVRTLVRERDHANRQAQALMQERDQAIAQAHALNKENEHLQAQVLRRRKDKPDPPPTPPGVHAGQGRSRLPR